MLSPPEQNQAAKARLPELEGRDAANDKSSHDRDPQLVVELFDAVCQDPAWIGLLSFLADQRKIRIVAQRLLR